MNRDAAFYGGWLLSESEQRTARRYVARLGTRGRRGARAVPNLRVDVVFAPHVHPYDPRLDAQGKRRVK